MLFTSFFAPKWQKTYAEIAIFRKNSKNEVSELLFGCSGGHHPLARVSLMKTDAGIRRRS